MKLSRIELRRVEYMPKQLEFGILYASDEYEIASHLCACGCGAKVITPLGTTDWSLRESARGPSMWPSIGNWQEQCQSHYIISDGGIIWCGKWTPEQILAGRQREQERAAAYYKDLYADKTLFGRVVRWVKEFFGAK